jgi:hypothetical protein
VAFRFLLIRFNSGFNDKIFPSTGQHTCFFKREISESYAGRKAGSALGPGFTQPLTEMRTRNMKIIMFLGSKVRRERRADNITAIYESIV